MRYPQILHHAHEVIPELEAMELDREMLVEAVRAANSEKALCTKNDIRGFDLITMQAKLVRYLRDAFCGDNWERDGADNQGGIRNERLKIRIIACNFDHNTASLTKDPTNLVPKGSATRTKARCNATAWLPNLPLPTLPGREYQTWVLGANSDETCETLKAELSLPCEFEGHQYKTFEKRIILMSGIDSGAPIPSKKSRDPDGSSDPTEVIDISVFRRK